jgi:type IV pilus assembly protein PilM
MSTTDFWCGNVKSVVRPADGSGDAACRHRTHLEDSMTRTMVGLDIGSSGVRAAEFVPGRRRTTLRRYASVPLTPGVVRAGTVVDGDALTDALRTLWSKGKFGTREVRIGIANAGVLVRQMDLDWMPPADFRKALRYQVQDALPIPVDDANLDYHLLDEVDLVQPGAEPRRVARILLVAAAREMVDAFVDAARRARLRTVGVDLLPFALVRTRSPQGLDGAGEVEAIVDIGADVVSVVVHAGGVPHYVRIIPGVGGHAITEAVRQRYEWTWEDAERTKIYVGLPGHAHLDASQLQTVGPGVDGLEHAAQGVVVSAVRELADEIASTLTFYRDTVSDAPHDTGHDTAHDTAREAGPDEPATAITRVLLTGSAARLGGLPELLEARLRLPVSRLEAADSVRTPRRLHLVPDDLSALAVTAGLCAGGAR